MGKVAEGMDSKKSYLEALFLHMHMQPCDKIVETKNGTQVGESHQSRLLTNHLHVE